MWAEEVAKHKSTKRVNRSILYECNYCKRKLRLKTFTDHITECEIKHIGVSIKVECEQQYSPYMINKRNRKYANKPNLDAIIASGKLSKAEQAELIGEKEAALQAELDLNA